MMKFLISNSILALLRFKNLELSSFSETYLKVSESNRSVPSYVALSEQGEWLVGKMAENYAVCLQNVIYGYFKKFQQDFYDQCLQIFDGFWERQMVKLALAEYKIKSNTFSNICFR